jgi:hypothetical protein
MAAHIHYRSFGYSTVLTMKEVLRSSLNRIFLAILTYIVVVSVMITYASLFSTHLYICYKNVKMPSSGM